MSLKKKRCRTLERRTTGRSSMRGQITIFIILGLIILFVAILMLQLAKKVQIGELEEAREEVISKTFRKEALRLYVKECLNTALEEGLNKSGEQGGRIWKDQGGGVGFVEEVKESTGVRHPIKTEVRITYAITNGTYFPDEQYPCKEGKEPDFCKYKYPNSSIEPGFPIKFGETELTMRTIEGDLEKFLMAKTIECVGKGLKRQGMLGVEISAENPEMNLDILSDGIKVEATYPLTLSLAGEEVFHLAEFDFFYPSNFKKLLDAAVILPLKLDWSFVDFDYEDDLKSDYFTTGKGTEGEKKFAMRKSDYEEALVKFEGATKVSDEGDDLFVFEVGEGILKYQSQPYIFQFVRQNRPPALDYVQRDYCDEDGYDYLVIPGDDDLGTIDIKLSSDINLLDENTFLALDPDEDTSISFDFKDYKYIASQPLSYIKTPNSFSVESTENKEGRHHITLTAMDEHGAKDQQVVRILVDRTMKTDVSLWMPYEVYYQGTKHFYKDLFSAFSERSVYWVSKEDPVFIIASWPKESLTPDKPTAITLEYSSETENFGPYPLPEPMILTESGGCFSLPWLRSATCEINNYTKNDLKNWPAQLQNPALGFNHFKELTTNGKLGLTFAITYCEKNEQRDETEAKIEVKECVPHKNPAYPFAYPYHTYKFDVTENGGTGNFLGVNIGEEDIINPFLATHSCCNVNWELEPAGQICFENPEPNCYGGIEDYTSIRGYGYYILEQESGTCDGIRGNICNGPKEYELWNNELRCGTNGGSCSGIHSNCQDNLSWGYADTDKDGIKDGWCHGKMGCQLFCPEERVAKLGAPLVNNYYNPNERASREFLYFNDDDLAIDCGCSGNEGKPCDLNLDSYFNGICSEGDFCCSQTDTEDDDPGCYTYITMPPSDEPSPG